MLAALVASLAFAQFWNWCVAHQAAILTVVGVCLPSLITFLSTHPTAATPAILALIQLFCARFSILEHSDSIGMPIKLPLAAATPSMNPKAIILGSASGPKATTMLVLIVGGSLLFAPGARAQTSTPPPRIVQVLPLVAASDPVTPTPSQFGGCVGPWTCFQPSVVITPLAINLRTKTVEAGFSPGVGYGVTFHPGQWYAFGVDAYFNVSTAGGGTAAIAVMGKAVNGYLRFGWDKGFIGDSNATAPRLLFGVGTDIP